VNPTWRGGQLITVLACVTLPVGAQKTFSSS
jgi:hypothetical protein